jgi:hypothetical protein
MYFALKVYISWGRAIKVLARAFIQVDFAIDNNDQKIA